MLPLIVFVGVTSVILGAFVALRRLPGRAEQQVAKRLLDLSGAHGMEEGPGDSVVRRADEGPLPGIDRLASRTRAGARLVLLIERSGVRTTPSTIVAIGLACGAGLVLLTFVSGVPWLAPLAGPAGVSLPFLWLMWRRSSRLKKFEKQFPEALDLLSRAIRAGHAFPTAMGMVADEMREPVGPEFRKTFDQQNFGLPLRDALNQLSERMGLLDVKFFVTAVLIQRETGGNLSEILDNLATVVREQFKLLRQVRVHTAHGRFTGYVLTALPVVLAVVLSILNPDFMALLFEERMGQLMLLGAIVMQAVGFLWIRQVIKIEV